MSPQRPRLKRLRFLAYALWPTAMALGLAGCANPRVLTPGSLAAPGKQPTKWETEVAARTEASRGLSDGEGEMVVANAVAAHEKRRP